MWRKSSYAKLIMGLTCKSFAVHFFLLLWNSRDQFNPFKLDACMNLRHRTGLQVALR